MSRRFVTKREIDDLADRGETVLEVDARTTVTDVAHDHAIRRGVKLVRVDHPTSSPSLDQPADDSTRATVRSAVLAARGEVSPGLDEALDRVLGERG